MKLSEDAKIPILEDWVNLTEAGELLGVSRQHAYRLAQADYFETLHRIGTQPSYVVSKAEVLAKRKQRADEEQAKEERRLKILSQ